MDTGQSCTEEEPHHHDEIATPSHAEITRPFAGSANCYIVPVSLIFSAIFFDSFEKRKCMQNHNQPTVNLGITRT